MYIAVHQFQEITLFTPYTMGIPILNCFKIDNVRFGVLELDRDSIGALEIEIYYTF